MSISAKIQRVGTHIEFVTTIPVAVSVGVVVADHIFEIYTDCIFTALSRRKQIGLGNAAKYNVRLFYAVVDIRRTVVQLYYVLARVLRAYVSDLDGYINLVVCVFVKSRTHGSRFAFHNFPLEVGVALTISERKHYTAVVPTTVVAETVNVLVTARFVVAVTEIQSFLVLYKVVARLRACRGVGVAVFRQIVTEVLPSGVSSKITHVCIDKVSRRGDVAAQYLAYGVGSATTRATYPQRSVDIFLLQEAKFHACGTVDKHHHFAEFSARNNVV